MAMDITTGIHRRQSWGEEIANSVSHGVGVLAALVALPVLVVAAAPQGLAAIAGASLFAITMALLYLASTLYHALPHGKAKRVFHALDHSAIYLLIAGTYTPFTLGVLNGPWGWSLLVAVWGLAITGVALKSVGRMQHRWLSTALYIGMGWLALAVAQPLWEKIPSAGIVWLLAGGLAYTAGAGFYLASRVRYCHFVWHLFVLAGTGCHFVAVLWYAA
jgi:hemolysin III